MKDLDLYHSKSQGTTSVVYMNNRKLTLEKDKVMAVLMPLRLRPYHNPKCSQNSRYPQWRSKFGPYLTFQSKPKPFLGVNYLCQRNLEPSSTKQTRPSLEVYQEPGPYSKITQVDPSPKWIQNFEKPSPYSTSIFLRTKSAEFISEVKMSDLDRPEPELPVAESLPKVKLVGYDFSFSECIPNNPISTSPNEILQINSTCDQNSSLPSYTIASNDITLQAYQINSKIMKSNELFHEKNDAPSIPIFNFEENGKCGESLYLASITSSNETKVQVQINSEVSNCNEPYSEENIASPSPIDRVGDYSKCGERPSLGHATSPNDSTVENPQFISEESVSQEHVESSIPIFQFRDHGKCDESLSLAVACTTTPNEVTAQINFEAMNFSHFYPEEEASQIPPFQFGSDIESDKTPFLTDTTVKITSETIVPNEPVLELKETSLKFEMSPMDFDYEPLSIDLLSYIPQKTGVIELNSSNILDDEAEAVTVMEDDTMANSGNSGSAISNGQLVDDSGFGEGLSLAHTTLPNDSTMQIISETVIPNGCLPEQKDTFEISPMDCDPPTADYPTAISPSPTASTNMNMPNILNDDAEEEEEDCSSISEYSGDPDGADIYIVEKIIAKRKNPVTGVTEYRIKWKDYPSSANTWEPEKCIFDPVLIKQFEELEDLKLQKRQKKQEERQKAKTVKRKEKKRIVSAFVDSDSENEGKKITPRHEKGYTFEKIIGASKRDSAIYYLVKYKETPDPELILNTIVAEKHPAELIDYLHTQTFWVPA